MILVAVGEYDREQRSILEVREVRQDEIDAEVLVARERKPRVDEDPLTVELVEGHVLTDLAEPAERDDPECVAHNGWLRSAVIGSQCTDGAGFPSRLPRRYATTGWSSPRR